jgi:hypothetical protein
MQKTRRTRRQELVLEGQIHLPLTLFDFEKFREWHHSYRFSPTFQRRIRIVRRTNPVGRYDYRLLQRKQESQ